MEHRRLGRTDLNVSLICLGTMTWGQQNTEAEGHEQLDYAIDQGINFIDTAEMYSIPPRKETQGSTERIIGSWFQARGNRHKVILASKVVGRRPITWFRDDGSPTELSRAQIEEAIDKSLASSDRLPRPVSDPLPRPADAVGIQSDDFSHAGRSVQSYRGDAPRHGRPREGREDQEFRAVERERLGNDDVSQARRGAQPPAR